tara:strand:+ start:1688 stop:2125 length:438 start_codon:yes stop_codon:yes gene_type:complete
MKLIKIAVFSFSLVLFSACEKDNTNPISSNGIEKQTVSNNKSSIEYTYYQSIDDFTTEVNDAILSSESNASSTGDPHGFSIVENSNGYGISEVSNLNNSGVSQGDVNLCGNCGPLVGNDIQYQLNSEPCWWLIAFTDGVWGWDGC